LSLPDKMLFRGPNIDLNIERTKEKVYHLNKGKILFAVTT